METAATTAPVRAGRGGRTRNALIAATRVVIERDGYLAARIVDIAAEAAVATGSFYTHFAGKAEAFAAVLDAVQDEMLHAGVDDAHPTDGDVRRSVEAANRAYLEAYRRNARLLAAMEQLAVIDPSFTALRQRRSRAFVERSAAAVRRLQEAGLADPGLDPDIAARALSAMVSRMAYMTFVVGDGPPLDDLVTTLTRLWANALGMPTQG